MDKFLKYFEDEIFISWVLDPTEELNVHWEEYLKNNSAEKEEVELARLLLIQMQSKKEVRSGIESIELFSEIVKKLETRKQQSKTRRIGFSILKYAAVGLLFFTIGSTFYYYRMSDQFSDFSTNLNSIQNQQNIQLLLSDGNNIVIPEKESKIEYQQDGQLVINNRDTIQPQMVEISNDQDRLNRLFVPYGKNTSITLPDGTLAYLNAGSQLVYPNQFYGKKREVELIGEGFFEVFHNPEKPFIVKTHAIEIEVLGTKFNMSAYPADKIIETILLEGKVKLKESLHLNRKTDHILIPNQRAVFNLESAETKITAVNAANYITWYNGYLNFKELELNRAVKKLERYYNVRIRLADPLLGSRTISGKLELKDETDFVLNVLAKTASVELFKVNQSNYILK